MTLRLLSLLIALAATPADADLRAAFEAAGDGDWEVAYEEAGDSRVAADLLTWTRLRDGEGDFVEAKGFLAARPDWPGLDRLRARTEEAMPPDTPPEEVLAFFDGYEPQTGEGVLRLARAYEAQGLEGDAFAEVVKAWLTLNLTESGHAALLSAYPELLADHHAARTDMLLWRWRRAEAGRMLPLLPEGQRAVAEARIALSRGDRDVTEELEAVPAELRETPGLLYDRYSWHAGRGERSAAIALLESATGSFDALGEPFRWSGWRRSLARWLQREGEHERAYRLAANHFLNEGAAFADLEWLAGYIALRHLGAPDVALLHFQTMTAAVETPISLARGHYWSARAHAARGDPTAAQAAYEAAAEHQTAFYGLLASDQLGLPLDPALTGADPIGSAVPGSDLAQAALLLLEAGERGRAVLFFAELGRTLDAEPLAALGVEMVVRDEDYFALLLAKTAQRRGIAVPQILYPVHDLATLDLPAEPALSLAIARQESEFRADAGSPVGALGLMQLMPRTAEEVAGELDLPYSRARLTSDWRYNARLGARYLANLEEEFGPSPVMIAAGYNAGPSRPRIWMDERGDPRLGTVDVIDWIENIPFRETRNYVMRVTEAIPVYRARLSGETGEVRFADLLVGEKPLIRPRARPEPMFAGEDG